MLDIDGLVCDLDGVLYRGSEPIPGAAEKIVEIKARGIRLVFATNNATATVDRCHQRLRAMGIEADRDEILTSAVVTAEVVKQRGWVELTAFVIGLDGIRDELAGIGMHFADAEGARDAGLVVSSGDWSFDYAKLRAAAFALRNGAHLIATNDDPTYPTPGGLWPGAGSILAAVETASGRRAEVMGKPHRPMMEAAARRLESCEHIAVVGDQPLTDLAGADLMGWTKVLVLSGVTAGLTNVGPAPDLVLDSLAHLELD